MARRISPGSTRRPAFAGLLAMTLVLPLAGCISFGPKTPTTLMTLHAASPIAPGTTRTSDDRRSIAVVVPTTVPALATQRVMVRAGPSSIAYLQDALWAAAPAVLMRNLLAETITARTGRVVPDSRLLTSQPDTRLTGTLTDFGLDGPGMAVIVTYDATISKSGSPVVSTQRFTARVPVADEKPDTVRNALDQAANQVATQVADWVSVR